MTGLSNPKTIFGLHSVTPYAYSTGLYYGILRVLGGCEYKLSGNIVELRGGSNRYPYDAEDGNISAELNLNCMEYPKFLFELYLGKAVTPVNAEASGNASTFTNKYGSSVIAATGFLSTVTVGTAADLKFGKYIFKATGAAAGTLYWSSNIDQLRGTDASDFTDDTLAIQALTGVGSGSTHAITGHGITLTGGASAGAFVTGDTATFEVRPVNVNGGFTVTIGGLTDVYPEAGYICLAAMKGNQEMFELDVFRAKAVGMPIVLKEKSFSGWSVAAKSYYDSNKGGVFSIRTVTP